MTAHISTAVDYYKVIINEDTGKVLDFRAFREDETPEENIDLIHTMILGTDEERELASLIFESMTEEKALIDASKPVIDPQKIYIF